MARTPSDQPRRLDPTAPVDNAEAVKEAEFPCGPNAPGAIKSPYGQGFTRRAATHSRGSKRSPPIESAGIGHEGWTGYMARDEEIVASGKKFTVRLDDNGGATVLRLK